MNTKEMIEVMQAFEDGKAIQFEGKADTWLDLGRGCALWNWDRHRYRIKPEPEPLSLEDRVKAEYSGFEVVMLDYAGGYLLYLDEDCDTHRPHIEAQSKWGFYKFVYEVEGDLKIYSGSVLGQANASIQPIGVLFTKAAK